MKPVTIALACLLPAVSYAATPQLQCSEVTTEVPAEPEEVVRPKGFQWSGFAPVGVLDDGRAVHEGHVSVELGLRASPASAETVAANAACELAFVTGARVHLSHISAAGSVEALRRAKRDRVPMLYKLDRHRAGAQRGRQCRNPAIGAGVTLGFATLNDKRESRFHGLG